ncbi:Rha family transcriptional regulator [Bacillus subtilis]|uniref:Rha family transcriptional regulator n=1 Tax=Bacillus subtilis TaxID=1423 RepID=UPI00240D5EBE|nr:phage antirepressor KilAC domain-containing protein [Bacillus subtilis]WEZ22071.1 Rha family transcriptional regulator [Bacillus subtilis]
MENNLTVIERDGQLLADSREVAEMVGKRHSDLIRDIEGYIQFLENATLRSQEFFIKSTYKTEGNNKSYKHFLLTKMGCEMVANKMIGAKGVIFSARYVKAFNQMENMLKARPSLIDTYLEMNEDERAIAYFTERKAKRELQEQLKLVEPKVEKYQQFLDADGLMKIGTLAKILNIKGLGQNKLFAFLRDKKILMRDNQPYQTYVDRGYFKVKSKTTPVGNKSVTLVTPRGADYIADLINDKTKTA